MASEEAARDAALRDLQQPLARDDAPLCLRALSLPRSVDAGSALETFLVSAIAAVLGIRVYLELMDYPQVGGHGLHIAHMLWGGLLMLIALVVTLAFLGKRSQRVAAVAGGIGFGLFIDELGKFITSDNNYFFQPTFSLIYVIFVLLFLLFRAIADEYALTRQEHLVNAVDLLKEALIDRENQDEKERAVLLLRASGAPAVLVTEFTDVLAQITEVPCSPPRFYRRWQARLREAYAWLAAQPWFCTAVIAGFVLHAVVFLGGSLLGFVVHGQLMAGREGPAFVLWGSFVSSLCSALLVVVGVTRLRVSRLSAYIWFRRAILVSLLLTQFFNFYTEQLGAVWSLAGDAALLIGLRYVIRQERLRQSSCATTAPALGIPVASA